MLWVLCDSGKRSGSYDQLDVDLESRPKVTLSPRAASEEPLSSFSVAQLSANEF